MLTFFLNQRRRTPDEGFTLIELVVVLAVLGLLLALAVPRYLGARKRAARAEIDNILQEVKTLSWAYYQEYSVFPNDVVDISLMMPGGSMWTTPSVLAGGGAATFITWTSSGNASGMILSTDSCSITLSDSGGAAQGCNF